MLVIRKKQDVHTKAAERREFFSNFITKLFPDILLAQESIKKDH